MDCYLRNVSFQSRANLDLAYTPYGFSCLSQHPSSVGFAGQWRDAVSGLYPLGNGRRMYSPSVSRFTSPDVSSPFGNGGMNVYAYCSGEPVNYIDPSGLNRYGAWAQVRQGRHRSDSRALSAPKFPMSLRPQLEHFRQTVKKVHGENYSGETVVARLYKRGNPHNAYTRWDLTYSHDSDSFTASFVFGNPIVSLPAGNYAVNKNIFISGVGGYQPARGVKNYQAYKVGAADLEGFDLPVARHDRPKLENSAWSAVVNGIRNERYRAPILEELERFDRMLERYDSPEPPARPNRGR